MDLSIVRGSPAGEFAVLFVVPWNDLTVGRTRPRDGAGTRFGVHIDGKCPGLYVAPAEGDWFFHSLYHDSGACGGLEPAADKV